MKKKKKKTGKKWGKTKKNRGIANISRKGLEITLTFCILLFGRMFPRIIQRQIHPGMLFSSLKYDIFTNW